jgi:hypothetical protein
MSEVSSLSAADWWQLTTGDLQRATEYLLGSLPGGWLRRGKNFVRVAGVKYGSEPSRLSEDLQALAFTAAAVRRAGAPSAVLRAATFYHLRFENIHPLVEANGRIGRVILAKQLEESLQIPAPDVLLGLADWESDYRRLFATNDPPVMFELLLDLLSRITGVPVSAEDTVLPASLEPLHVQKVSSTTAPRLHPEQAMRDPAAVAQFLRRQAARRPPSKGAFRKFR